jgi:CSLREA domain-containing protein
MGRGEAPIEGRRGRFVLAVILSLGAMATLPASSLADTYLPTRTDDPAPGACAPSDCSLREAISAANTNAGADIIRLQSGLVYGLQLRGRNDDANATGDLDVNRSPIELSDELTITSTGSELATIDANHLDRTIDAAGVLTLSRIRIREGLATSSAGGGIFWGCCGKLTIAHSEIVDNALSSAGSDGGGIYAFTDTSGHISISDSLIARNSAPSAGGGLVTDGAAVSVSASTIAENQAGFGGGVATSASSSAPIALVDSHVLNNISTGPGGGILNWGVNTAVTVNRSLIFGNSAGPDAYNAAGGGIATISNDGAANTTVVSNSTISYNSSTLNGGGIVNHSIGGTVTLRMTNSTVAHNEAADYGGGIDSFANTGRANVSLNAATVAYNDANSNGDGVGQGGGLQHGTAGGFSVVNSLIARNTAITGPDCAGFAFTSGGHNLRSASAACTGFTASGDFVRTNPLIGDLADNGGPTETIALLDKSPAIGAGGTDTPDRDQRGVLRDPSPDIGAYEK